MQQVEKRSSVKRAVPSGSLSEESRARLDEIQDQLGELHEGLLLTDVQNEMEDMRTTLSLLPNEIEELRNRGYAFRSFLENKVEVLVEQWEDAFERVSDEVSRRVRELEREADEAESALRMALGGRDHQISRAENAVETLEHKVDGARSAIRALYDTLQQNVNQTKHQVKKIQWLLEQIDAASFRLYPAEDPVIACKADYLERRKKEGPKGILYLTDERLIFEQKEKIATKKVLFIATEKEEVQQLIFEVPVGQIEHVKASQKGVLGGKEMLDLRFGSQADLSGALLRLRGADNEEWAGLIGRIQSGEIDRDRARPKDEEVVEAARSAPTKCPACGATLDVEIVRGMREINCAYCGTVIRL